MHHFCQVQRCCRAQIGAVGAVPHDGTKTCGEMVGWLMYQRENSTVPPVSVMLAKAPE
jgi:hypothetical protein